jgi:hypothetical protein
VAVEPLLISIDGMQVIDLANYVSTHPDSVRPEWHYLRQRFNFHSVGFIPGAGGDINANVNFLFLKRRLS